ncbi:uncharacterized protein LOC124173660 isoform X2 [Ischnura elegans]|uniref:uncharacterized protein LOC124173660 isoform X2 n=1 Tax=Ischnura elegans TaxID=197161 RepID=UPI001ED87AF3|nr:uncharacterized protein LOC124173660 isoform X2 [Ischnura elegans]
MWNTLRVKSEDCFCYVKDLGEAYEFILSNLKCIWKNKLQEHEIVDIVHELNPQIEATPKVLVKKAIDSLFEINSHDEIDFTEESCGITLNLISTIGGFPFKFDLKLNLVHHENERERKLIDIIRLKDKEIEDYRLSGAQLSHKILKTKVFDEKEHMRGLCDSKTVGEVVRSPVKYFAASLGDLFEASNKEVAVHGGGERSSDGMPNKSDQHSPDLFDEADEPLPKVMAVPRKMPTLLKVDTKPQRNKSKKNFNLSKKLKI